MTHPITLLSVGTIIRKTDLQSVHGGRKELDFYGTDEELKKEEQEKSDMHQIRMGLITAVIMAGIVIGLMLLPFAI